MNKFVSRGCFCVAHHCEVVAYFWLRDLICVTFYFYYLFSLDFLVLIWCNFEFTLFHFKWAFVSLGVWVNKECKGCELLQTIYSRATLLSLISSLRWNLHCLLFSRPKLCSHLVNLHPIVPRKLFNQPQILNWLWFHNHRLPIRSRFCFYTT